MKESVNKPTEYSPELRTGVFKGTRVPVSAFIEFMGECGEECNLEEFRWRYPEVSIDQLVAFIESTNEFFEESRAQEERIEKMKLDWLRWRAAKDQDDARKEE